MPRSTRLTSEPREQPKEFWWETTTPFELIFHGGETRDRFITWGHMKGWALSYLARDDPIKAVTIILNLAKQMVIDREVALPKEPVEELEETFYGQTNAQGYPTSPVLSALKKDRDRELGEESFIYFSGWMKGNKLIAKLPCYEYDHYYNSAYREVFALNGPFYTLLEKVTSVLDNRFQDFIKEAEEVIEKIAEDNQKEEFRELVQITKGEEMTKEEQEIYRHDYDDSGTNEWIPEKQDPTKKGSFLVFSNNPFKALETVVSLSLGKFDVNELYQTLITCLKWIQMGMKGVYDRKDGKRAWYIVSLKRKELFQELAEGVSFLRSINYFFSKWDLTLEETKELSKIRRGLITVLLTAIGKIYSIISYTLGFRSGTSTGGTSFDFIAKGSKSTQDSKLTSLNPQ